jgi:Protein of unknown function (DUF3040)
MTLAAGDRRALAKIEKNLRGSDPKLAAMLSTFNRLTQAEQMPQREVLAAPSLPRRLRARPGPKSGSKSESGSKSGFKSGSPSRRRQLYLPAQPGSGRRPGSQPDPGRARRDPGTGRNFRPSRYFRPSRDYRLGRDSRLGRNSSPDGDLSPAHAASPDGHSSTQRLPSQGHYPHTSRLPNPGRYHGRSRVTAILSLTMAACALGLMVVLFSVLNHVRPAGATPAPATTCHYVMMTGCQSAAYNAHKR